MLDVSGVRASYGRGEVLSGVDLAVKDGEAVALLGANGAGKTTLFRVVAGLLRPTAGDVRLHGASIVGRRPHEIARAGIGQAPEGRQVIPSLSVRDNIALAARYARGLRGAELVRVEEEMFDFFPALGERPDIHAGALSGGQQQMLAIARALATRPRLLLLDEPSLGLAPVIVEEIYESLGRRKAEGLAMLIIEQNAMALTVSDRGYVLARGRVVVEEAAQDLAASPELWAAYLGGGAA